MGRNRIVQNASLTILTTIIQGVLNLTIVIYLARVLKPEIYGEFSYTWVIIGMVGVLAYAGLPSFLTRELSRSDKAEAIIGYGSSLIIMISLLVTIGFGSAVQLVPSLYRYHLLFDPWLLFLCANSLSPRWIYIALSKLWVPSVADLMGTALRAIFTLWLVRNPADVTSAVIITGLTLILPLIIEYGWLHQRYRFRLKWISVRDGWKTLRMAFPLGVSEFIGILYSGVDTWILHGVLGSKAVGIYSAAYRPVTFLTMFSGIYFNLSFPILSRNTLANVAMTRKVLRLATVFFMVLIIPLGMGTGLIALPLISLAFGHLYAASGLVLTILIWSWSIGMVRNTFSITLLAANHEAEFARIFAYVGIINVVFVLLLVRWGPVGTAVALVLSQVVLAFLCIRAVHRVIPHPLDWPNLGVRLLKIMGNTLVMGGFVLETRRYVPVELSVFIGMLVYGGLTWMTHAMPWQEILDMLKRAS